ncbi:hypothetical protein WCX72_09125 [Sulfurimonas sp. HSL1-6]|uniref:hypothetical protein n=1 Tax=Thiomicrolovo immobilis TaxID=3131935 RepID=UPI0031F96634
MKTTGWISTVLAGVLGGSLYAADANAPKQALNSNYTLVYNAVPGEAESFTEMFSEGEFYARLRSNTFYYKWQTETAKQDSHLISALGGSLVYRSARYGGFDFGMGLYYSQAFFDDSNDPVNTLKPGKDVLSRYDYVNMGNKGMGALGQAYIAYSGIPKTRIAVGRQLVETFYTKSNDTKMIPNTFDGIVIDTKAVPATAVRVAYLAEQKLRDHTQAHSVLMYGDANSSSSERPEWSENDDSAMHKGLTYTRLKAAGKPTDAPLITGDLHNTAIANLKLDGAFYIVPELVSEVMAEANYKVNLGSVSLTPGVRYIKQFDNGAGKVGGAAYSGKLAGQSGAAGGYKEADSLDAQMLAARLVAQLGKYKLNFGYTKVFNEADLITPWRGFPTAGYTRSMARYNWMANTKSYRVELQRAANKTGVFTDLFVQASFLHTDADESKGYYDENYYYLGFVQNLPMLADLQWRLRLGYNDTEKPDADSLDARFELNYLF